MKHLSPLSSVLEALNYTYDASGNRISMNRQSVSLPLRSAVTDTNYNEANQMLRYNAASDNIGYDENGNMISKTDNCGTTSFTWDARNRLVGISGFTNDCSLFTSNFKYDALGRRIEKTINGRTIQYLYDGLDIVQEIENTVVSANYVRTMNIDEPLARVKADGSVRYYQQDALGSVIALTDDTGAVKTQYSYDPFGGATISGEVSDNPFQYTGRENDNTGLYYYRARYYSPELQRFISEDPIRLRGGINFFAYVGNNPVKFIDPSGLVCVYSQSTGSLTCTDDIFGYEYLSCKGYAGSPLGYNNPAFQWWHNVGPLPQGDYTVGGPNNSHGPITRPLTPSPNNNMFGRGGFLIHGDNNSRNNTGSEGCIVADPDCRSRIPTGETLRVVP
jgi:RHS repeat-associated protein